MVAGQTIFITGAGSGLGAALSHRFVDEGANVALVDVDLDRARSVADELDPERVLPLAADVRESSSLHTAVGETIARFSRLDTVIPNAGIWDFGRSVTRLSGDELSQMFDDVMAVNAKGYLLTVEATWRHLLETRGSIIMTLSNSSFYAAGGGPVYTASKFAGRGLVTEFAYELAPKIRVNGVAVGGMSTNLSGPASAGLDNRKVSEIFEKQGRSEGNPYIPLHHASVDPVDFTGPYVMLASTRNAGNITGHIINADGGIAARGFAKTAGGDDL